MTAQPDPDVAFPELTPREREVLGHLVDGKQPEAIARRMTIAEKTVRNNISSLLTKLHVSDRASAIERARQAGMGQGRPTTEVRTLMFTEIADSTQLVRRLGDAYTTVLADHNRIVGTAVETHGGTPYASAGDARAAWFRDPSAAIAASIDAHRKLSSHAFVAGAEVRIRVGIHRGAVTTHGEELVGVALHEVARVASTAVGGETLVTDEGMPGDLAPKLRLVDLGERELRDFDRPTRLFRVEFLP